MKLCVHCKHYGFGDCYHPDLTRISPVTGKRLGLLADDVRDATHMVPGCGPLAVRWEAREKKPAPPPMWWAFWRWLWWK